MYKPIKPPIPSMEKIINHEKDIDYCETVGGIVSSLPEGFNLDKAYIEKSTERGYYDDIYVVIKLCYTTTEIKSEKEFANEMKLYEKMMERYKEQYKKWKEEQKTKVKK